MVEVWNVAIREGQGTRDAQRLRSAGQIPAVLYGHKEDNVCLSVPAEEVARTIRNRGQLVDLRGAIREAALIRAVQWDALGADVLHVDLGRVSAGEKAEVTVSVELRGEAPGSKEGGMVQQLLREVELECPVRAIPEVLEISINDLHLGQSLTAGQLELPDGASLRSETDAVVVQCVEAIEVEPEVAPAATAEPEVIGRPEEAEEES